MSNVRAKIKSYAKTVSTGNLNRHLRDVHDVKEEEKAAEIIRDYFNTQLKSKTVTANPTSSKSKKNTLTLAKDMVIWCCKSLISFDSISDEATKDFFQKYKIIGTKEEMPTRDTVCRIALDSIYESMLEDVKTQITADCVGDAAVACDVWTNSCRRQTFATLILHYITTDFEHKEFTLGTKLIDRGKGIKVVFKEVMTSFGLQEKKIYCVIDAKSERTTTLSHLDKHFCLGHALNDFITIDGIRGVSELDAFVKKCKRIVKNIECNTLDLQIDCDEMKAEFINSLERVSESLENDEREPIVSEDEENQSETQDAVTPTRWYIIIDLLECLTLLGNRNSFNKMLSLAGKEELRMSQREWNLLEDAIKFLTKFRGVAEMITTQTTTSLNLAMVFRLEVKDILNSVPDEEAAGISLMKQRMLAKMEARFPVTDEIVMAAMLDPRFVSLSQIDTYLERRDTTRESFLAAYVKANQSPNSVTSPVFIACGTNSNEFMASLLKKHSDDDTGSGHGFDDAKIECRNYLATAAAERFQGDDVLLFWREKKNSFPMLSEVARALLAIPVTSMPSERIFSEVGLALAVKRSRLTPLSVNKVMFIHDNYKG